MQALANQQIPDPPDPYDEDEYREGSDADPLQPTGRQRELLQLTLEVWQPLSSRQLSDEDAREILANVTGFFGVLAKWDRGLRQSAPSQASPQTKA
jgi:hypothetical protein